MKLIATSTVKNPDGGDAACVLCRDKYVFTGNDNGLVKVFSSDELKLITEMKAHAYPIYHMTLDSKNNQILTCSSDMTIVGWNYTNGEFKKMKSWEGHHKDAIRKLCIYEEKLYSGDEAGEVLVWNFDGVCLSQVGVQEEIWDLDVQNNTLLTARDRDVLISEIREKDGKINISIKMTIKGRSPLFVNHLYVAFTDCGGFEILVYKNEAGYPLVGKLKGHSLIINAIAGSGNFLYSGGWDKKVIGWDMSTLSCIGEVTLDFYINALTVDSSNNKLFATGQDGLISVINLKA